MYEPNRTHFFESLGVLPEGKPINYLGFLVVEPDETSDNLLLMHGWLGLSEAATFPLAVCRSVLRTQGAVQGSGLVTTSERSAAQKEPLRKAVMCSAKPHFALLLSALRVRFRRR